MAVLANDVAAPADLREKSLRLAAHLLEYDPKLRGGSGIRPGPGTARQRRGAKADAERLWMRRALRPAAPIWERRHSTLRHYPDGTVSGIDCLQLNRLARTAGAPIDKGAGIGLFKKIGDQVEQGEPLYRVYARDSRADLATATAKTNSGYTIDGADMRSAR